MQIGINWMVKDKEVAVEEDMNLINLDIMDHLLIHLQTWILTFRITNKAVVIDLPGIIMIEVEDGKEMPVYHMMNQVRDEVGVLTGIVGKESGTTIDGRDSYFPFSTTKHDL